VLLRLLFLLFSARMRCDAMRCDSMRPAPVGCKAAAGAMQLHSSFLRPRTGIQNSTGLTFCWRHSLQARFTAVLRRDEGRVSPSPLSWSSSLEAERLNPRVLVGLVGDMAKACWEMPCVGLAEGLNMAAGWTLTCAPISQRSRRAVG
jgi:hypothetical protein